VRGLELLGVNCIRFKISFPLIFQVTGSLNNSETPFNDAAVAIHRPFHVVPAKTDAVTGVRPWHSYPILNRLRSSQRRFAGRRQVSLPLFNIPVTANVG
jgi:hypothetical protein